VNKTLSNRKFLLCAFGVLVLFFSFWSLWRGYRFYQAQGKKEVEESGERGYVKALCLTSSRGSEVIWVMKAGKAQLSGDKIRLWDIMITYFFEPGKPVIIKGLEGCIDRKREMGEIWGDVTVTHQGETLYVDRMSWETKKNILESSLPFIITGKYRIEGVGFVAKPSLGWVRVKKLKKAVFY